MNFNLISFVASNNKRCELSQLEMVLPLKWKIDFGGENLS